MVVVVVGRLDSRPHPESTSPFRNVAVGRGAQQVQVAESEVGKGPQRASKATEQQVFRAGAAKRKT